MQREKEGSCPHRHISLKATQAVAPIHTILMHYLNVQTFSITIFFLIYLFTCKQSKQVTGNP